MKRLSLLGLMLIGGLVAVLTVPTAPRHLIGDERPAVKPKFTDKPGLQAFMHRKLDFSQGVLEGLVTEDFALIEKSAAGLSVLSKAAEWQVSNDMLYRQHSNEFQRVLKQLEKGARDKNIDGSSLAFVQMTMNCIECHRFVRDKLVATGDR